jgi:hypothetical protein
MAKRAGRRSGEAKEAIIARQIRKEQLRSGKAVEAGVMRRGFDVQHKTGGGSKPALMVSQQMERAAKLQDPEVRAELNRRVRECERKRSTGGRIGSIPQASARARQQATCEQVKSQECLSRGSSTREQENPEVRGGVSIANKSGSIVSSHKSTTSRNSYSSPIVRARPQHRKKAREPSY